MFIRYAFSTLLMFFLLFSFAVPLLKTSSVLAFILASTYILCSKRIHSCYDIFSSKLFLRYLLSAIVIGYSSVIIAYIHGTFDFSILSMIITQIIYICFTVVVSAAIIGLLDVDVNKDEMEKYSVVLAIVFSIQTLIMIFAAFNSSVRDVVQLFQPSSAASASERYNGLRGVALASGQFFSLSVAYGLAIIYFSTNALNKKVSIKNVALFSALVVGTLFAGRTAFVSFPLVIIFYLYKYKINLIMLMIKLIVTVAILALLCHSLFPTIYETVQKDIFGYAFEFIYNYLEYGKLETSSTNKLDTMYFDLDYETIIAGDGWLFNQDGSYYMHTDAGYMRYVLYGGITFLLILFTSQLFVFYKFDLNFLMIITYLLITNYKGMSLSLLLITQTMIFMFSIFQRSSNFQKISKR